MKIVNVLQIGIFPIVLMAYGWYLGQLHQSGYDVAGIFLFITGLVGMALALLTFVFTRRASWHRHWYLNILLGAAGCALVFGLVLVYARLHG